jgi:hypothetical protein
MTFRYLELFSAVGALFFAVIFPISMATRLREAGLIRRRGE